MRPCMLLMHSWAVVCTHVYTCVYIASHMQQVWVFVYMLAWMAACLCVQTYACKQASMHDHACVQGWMDLCLYVRTSIYVLVD